MSIRETYYGGRISVDKSVSIGDGTWNAATVNWSACGSQPVQVCREFLKELRKAIDRAEELDSKLPEGTRCFK